VDDLTAYVINNYSSLMTEKEQLARRAILAEQKAKASSEPMAEMLRTRWGSSDPAVVALFEHGADQFHVAVRDRLLREHAEQVFLNRCPKCDAIAQTPKAKQCFACGHDWH